MNIKSLILGSAAALVAGGAAQAADLPVAEPVDYVKVCDAYGAGYFFIPGTDTCMKIFGSVTFGATSESFMTGKTRTNDRLYNFYTETTLRFQLMEETEYGTLMARMEYDDESTNVTNGGVAGAGTAIDKAWLQLGGLYAGLTDSALDFNAGPVYDDFGYGYGDVNTIGYRASLGNGVTATIALEEYDGNANSLGGGARQSVPALVASLAVKQGWGSAVIGAGVNQVRYASAAFDTDMGWTIGGEVEFNLMEGLTLGLAGGYGMGNNSYLGDFQVLAGGYTGAAGTLNANYAASAGLTYAFADNISLALDAGMEYYNDRSATNYDSLHWGVSTQLSYTPVKNLTVAARVGYQKTDYNSAAVAAGEADWDDYRARITLERSF
nr:porin [uncultured Cohaesibacter sp.]